MNEARLPRILFVTSVYPHGVEYGAQQRVVNLMRIFGGIGDISIVFACGAPIDQEKIRMTQKEFRVAHTAVVNTIPSLSLINRLRFELDPTWMNGHLTAICEQDRLRIVDLISQHDVTCVHTLRTANECGIWQWPRTILDIDYIPSQVCASSGKSGGNALRKVLDWRMSAIWRRRERCVQKRFDMITVCSENDRAYLDFNENKVRVIPNGFRTDQEAPARKRATPPRIGFVGWFGGLPNREGMEWFIGQVWPRVKRAVPDARLRLVGGDVDLAVFGATPDTDILGYIEDPTKEMCTWAANIVPIRVGSGTRIKIAHAFSIKCPVVSTSLGACGYDVASGNELLIGDSPAEFAAACVRLIEDPDFGYELAERAWSKYSKSWSWDAITPAVHSAVQTVLSNSSPGVSARVH